MKRLLSVFLALLLLAGCGQALPASAPSDSSSAPSETSSRAEDALVETDTLRLPCAPGDTLNPFSCESDMNFRLIPLVHRSLVLLGSDYTPANDLAERIASTDRLVYRITLRKDVIFSDGSPLTARDVVVSINAARASAHYAASLSGIADVAEADDYSLLVTLNAPDPRFANLLTFPIVKYGTQMSDSPVGCGLYVRESEHALALNPSAEGAAEASIRRIELVEVDDYKALLYLLANGEIDMAVSDMLPGDMSLSGSAVFADENRFLFLGVNRQSTVSRGLCEALACAVDREALLQNCYSGCGAAAATPFNPRAAAFSSLESGLMYDPSVLSGYIADAGYTEKDEEGYYVRRNQRFSLDLLVNSDNALRILAANEIAAQLAEYGVEVNITRLPYSRYLTALQNGDFDLYLGEVRLPLNLDLSALMDPASSLVYGRYQDSALGEQWQQAQDGQRTYASFLSSFEYELPFIPLLYHDTALSYCWELQGEVDVSLGNFFSGIAGWKMYSVKKS